MKLVKKYERLAESLLISVSEDPEVIFLSKVGQVSIREADYVVLGFEIVEYFEISECLVGSFPVNYFLFDEIKLFQWVGVFVFHFDLSLHRASDLASQN